MRGLNAVYGDKVIYKVCDAAKQEQVKELVQYAVEKYGALDIMVNNAGMTGTTPLIAADESVNLPDYDKVLGINLYGVIYGTKYAADQMIKQGNGGAIVSTASMFGLIGANGGTGYCASKHAVVGMTKCWAAELAPHNIRVNAICPGYVLTNLTGGEVPQEVIHALMALQPLSQTLGRLGDAEEQAHAIIFMIENTFLTGQAIAVDGGYLAGKQ